MFTASVGAGNLKARFENMAKASDEDNRKRADEERARRLAREKREREEAQRKQEVHICLNTNISVYIDMLAALLIETHDNNR